jgi:hypothetical protein
MLSDNMNAYGGKRLVSALRVTEGLAECGRRPGVGVKLQFHNIRERAFVSILPAQQGNVLTAIVCLWCGVLSMEQGLRPAQRAGSRRSSPTTRPPGAGRARHHAAGTRPNSSAHFEKKERRTTSLGGRESHPARAWREGGGRHASFCLAHDLFRRPVSTFRDHALSGNGFSSDSLHPSKRCVTAAVAFDQGSIRSRGASRSTPPDRHRPPPSPSAPADRRGRSST